MNHIASAGSFSRLREAEERDFLGAGPPPGLFVAQMGKPWRKWATFGRGTSLHIGRRRAGKKSKQRQKA